MQCATAPTRSECDKAHARGKWLDVRVMSVRNLTKIGWRRPLIWGSLALSSTPIHLLYNSAVFKTTDNNDYSAVIAGEDFLSASYNVTATDSLSRQVHRAYLADQPRGETLHNVTVFRAVPVMSCLVVRMS